VTNWEPEVVTALDMGGLKASITQEGDTIVMVIEDEDTAVHLEPGASNSLEQAILGAERLADVAHQYAALLRVRAGSRRPLTWLSPEPAT
jgi:hypothetical protein